MKSLVMTILGADRPGVVESLAKLVNQHGGNWLESRMAHLAGQFAGIVHVEVPPSDADKLVEALRAVNGSGLTIIVQLDDVATSAATFAPLRLEIVGNDRPGIVHEITRVLAELAVNVEEFSSECMSAAMSGGRIFQATAKLRLPTGTATHDVQEALEQIAHDLMVDIRWPVE